MQLILESDNDTIIAVHHDNQDVVGNYPAGSVTCFIPNGTAIFNADGTFKAVSELGLTAEQKEFNRDVRIIDSGQLSQTTIDDFNNATTIAGLKAWLRTVFSIPT